MRKLGKKKVCVWAALLACMIAVCAVAFAAYAQDDSASVLTGEGDTIAADGQTYEKEQAFSYSARITLQDGNVAGLAWGVTDTQAYVWLIDRDANRLKLIYFTRENEEANWSADAQSLREEPFIGNGKTTAAEYGKINPRVAARATYDLRVEYDGAGRVRLYADDIERLRDWSVENYNGIEIGAYDGGQLGRQVFFATAQFDNVFVGASDTPYYTEPYRPQYHFTQGAYWNNDPNGMVYFNGWYHLFYQHNPYGKTWSDMYWGHARSKDLLHWEHLPVCLFPDGGYMWSGSAAVCDNLRGMFGESAPDAAGLIAYLTREAGRQEQILIYSDDEGVTWKKHGVVIATEQNSFYDPANAGIAFRDPKIFEIGNGTWGIIVGGGRYQFYVSSDRVHWEYSSCLPVDAECPDIVKIATADGDKWVITMSSRQYLVGELRYEDNKIKFFNESGKELTASDATLADCNVRTMDFGPDAYASQTFYIADRNAAYYGKAVAISWFNNPLIEWGDNAGAMAALRDPWNGGFTFPVELGLRKVGDEYVLTQTPVEGIADIEETVWETDGERTVSATDENILAQVRGAQLDITAQVAFTAGAHFGLRVQEGIDGYIEIGYDQTGYYVDRSHASNGGTEIPRYLRRYDSHTQAAEGVATWRILTDANSVEVFAEHGTVAFFAASFPSQGSTGVSLFTDADITVQSLTVRRVASVWRAQDALQGECTVLRLSAQEMYLDSVFASSRTVAVFADGDEAPQWSIAPQGVATLETDESGYAARLTAVRAGDAAVTVTCGNKSATVAVHVGGGSFAGNVTASAETVLSGGWNITADGALRCNASGDADILMNERADDFVYTARFALTDGQAAALTFRAESDLSAYYKANYDHAQKAVKLWTRDKVTGRVRELANVPYTAPDSQNITITVRALGYAIRVSVNGREVICVNDYDVNAPREGLFGLNAFNGETRFMQVSWESTFKAANDTITADMPFVVTVGMKTPQNVMLNGTMLKEEQYRVASGQLFINAGVAQQGENVLTFTVDGEEQRFAFTVTAFVAVAPAKPSGGLAGWAIALIVIACVLVAGGGAFCVYWFVLRGKRSAGKAATVQDTPTENTKTEKEEEDGGKH